MITPADPRKRRAPAADDDEAGGRAAKVVRVRERLEFAAPVTPAADRGEEEVPLFAVKQVVVVAPRTHPGYNREGGVARITAVNDERGSNEPMRDGSTARTTRYTYAVKYVLSGHEKRVDAQWIRAKVDETHKRFGRGPRLLAAPDAASASAARADESAPAPADDEATDDDVADESDPAPADDEATDDDDDAAAPSVKREPAAPPSAISLGTIAMREIPSLVEEVAAYKRAGHDAGYVAAARRRIETAVAAARPNVARRVEKYRGQLAMLDDQLAALAEL